MADDRRALLERRRELLLARRQALAGAAGVAPTAPTDRTPAGPSVGTGAGIARAAGQGLTFGFSDELAGAAAGLGALLPGGRTPGEAYGQTVASEREKLEAFREANPGLAIGAEIAGTLPTLLVPGAGAARGASLAARGARTLAGGVAGAGLYGAGAAEGGLGSRATGAGTGAAVGLATAGAGRGVGRLLRGRGGRQAAQRLVEEAPSTASLRREGGALFEAARRSGEEVAGDTFAGFARGLRQELRAEGVDKVLHPKVARALRNMVKLSDEVADGGSLNFQELFTLRRNLALGGRSLEPDERRLASRAIEALDDFVETEAAAAGALSRQARSAWSRMRKSELIEDTIRKGADQKVGAEAGIRNAFSALLRNDKKMRGFTQDERAALRAISEGNLTQNTLRLVGSLGWTGGQQRNILALLGGIFGGGVVGGPVGGVAAPVAGTIAQRLAERGTRGRADFARALAATGGRIPVPPRAQDALAEALARRAALPAAVVVNQ